MSPPRGAEREARPSTQPFAIAAILVAVTVLAALWYVAFSDWWVNSDGSAYLSLGLNIRRGEWFLQPDGSHVTSLRGPFYPLLLAAPWSGDAQIGRSIWMSRLPLILAPALVGAFVWRETRLLVAAAVACAVALAQPWSLLAGGSLFVPDGLVAFTVIAAVAAATIAGTSLRRMTWYVTAGVFVVLAAATKETGLIALPLVGCVWWAQRFEPGRLARAVVLAAIVPATLGALVLFAGRTDVALVDLPANLFEDLADKAYGAHPAWALVAAVAALLVAQALARSREPLQWAGLLLVVSGVGIGVYAAGRGYGPRNAALVPYGLAVLCGAFAVRPRPRDASPRVDAHRMQQWLAAAAAALLVIGGVAGTARYHESAARRPAWNNEAAAEAERWLERHAGRRPIGCTLLYCSYFWLRSGGRLDVRLLPQYAARLGPTRFDELEFSERAGWASRVTADPPRGATPLVLTMSDQLFGAVFEEPLLAAIRREHLEYLVITGIAGNSATFEAGWLVPYLDRNPALRRVFTTDPAALPDFVAIYQVVGPPRPLADAPLSMSKSAKEALPDDAVIAGLPAIDTPTLIRQITAGEEGDGSG